jgi:glycosyltransferase involved in cell wall biosynthesis
MTSQILLNKDLRLHLTNVSGAGATQLMLSLLPKLERNSHVKITEIYLPNRGPLANYQKLTDTVVTKNYRRWLPNGLSRFFECLIFSYRFSGVTPLLVLGDLPLRCNAPQTVFVQTSHLLKPKKFHWRFGSFKFAVLRLVFRLNAQYAEAFIVQTTIMQAALAASYPAIASKIHVVAQPVPSWLLESVRRRYGSNVLSKAGLKLMYPAAGYPHKNHRLLSEITQDLIRVWPVEYLKLTLPVDKHPFPNIQWIQCVGFLNSTEMIKLYGEVDGLVFLSTDESYGFPLLEAMFVGLPIICPDLPYAHTLCLDSAIYFDPLSIDSLRNAIETLHSRLSAGWWPNWTEQLKVIPKDWDLVADAMIGVAIKHSVS